MKSTTGSELASRVRRLVGDDNSMPVASNDLESASRFDDNIALDAMNHAIKTYANVTDRTRRETYYTIDANGESRLPFDNLELKQAVVSIDDLFDVTITTTANPDEVAVNSTVDFDYTVASTIPKDHSEYNKVWTFGSDTATTDTYSKLIETPGEYSVSLLLQDSETKQSDTDSLAFKAYLSPTITISGEENPIVGDPYTYTINVTNSIYWPETYEWSTSETTQSVVKTFATAGAHTFSGKASIVDHPTFTSGFADKTVNAYIPYVTLTSTWPGTNVDNWQANGGSDIALDFTGYIYSVGYDNSTSGILSYASKYLGDKSSFYGGHVRYTWAREYNYNHPESGCLAFHIYNNTNSHIRKFIPTVWQQYVNYTTITTLAEGHGWVDHNGNAATESYIRDVLSNITFVKFGTVYFQWTKARLFSMSEEPV